MKRFGWAIILLSTTAIAIAFSGIPGGGGSASTNNLGSIYCSIQGCDMDGGLITSVLTTDELAPINDSFSIGVDSGSCAFVHGQRYCSDDPDIPFYAIPSGTTNYTLSATKTFQGRSWSHSFVLTRAQCTKTNSPNLTDGGTLVVSTTIPAQTCICQNKDAGRSTMLCTTPTGMIEAPCALTDGGPCLFPGGGRANFSFYACGSASAPVVSDCVLYGHFTDDKGVGSQIGLPFMACVGQSLCNALGGTPTISSSPDAGEELSFQFQNQTDYPILTGASCSQIPDTNVGPWVRTDDTPYGNESIRPGTAKGFGSPLGVYMAARGGATYILVKKGVGDVPWTWWTNGLQGAVALSNTGCYLGTEFQLGEANEGAGTTALTWATYMDEWQSDAQIYLRSHVPCIGLHWSSYPQSPIIIMQLASSTMFGQDIADHVPAGQLLAAQLFPDRITLAGPQYWTGFKDDGVHHSAIGTCLSQTMFGNVLREWWARNSHWSPTWMTDAVWDSSTGIDVTWHVPYPPLVLECPEDGTDPGNYGMTFTDDSGTPPSITSVTLTGCPQWETCTMHVELDSTPSGTGMFIESAYRGTLGEHAGPSTGMRSCIHDSATWTSNCGSALDGSDPQLRPIYNWAVHQAQTVN